MMKTFQRLISFVLTMAVLVGLMGYAAPVSYATQEDHAHTDETEHLTQSEEQTYDLTQPFDQTYPELVEMEAVDYEKDTLLLKLPADMGGAVTEEMAQAGVTALTRLFAMEDAVWFEARLATDTDIHAAVEALRAIEEILLVDYNYYAEVNGMADPEDIPADLLTNPQAGQQWYLEYCGIPSGMALLDNPGGTSDVIVAVIDTGVDIDHEDLANNIWVNEYEIPGNGMDDDGNGYVDDYYGVNLNSGYGNGDDDHGHGTHVAGIIAAENNDIGVVGIAYNVKIMPIKASSSAGMFNQADIAKAVLYAYANGAHVINMSFGGTACSIAVQDALRVAFSECVLVASAGNDHRLGSHEAPPAIISIFLGDELNAVVQSIVNGSNYTDPEKSVMRIGVDVLPQIPKDTTDRNRTSPLAFTGNKFEFRMLGSSQSIADSNIALNTIMAEELGKIADELELADDFETALQQLVCRILTEHQRIIFNGNGYSVKWTEEAARRGLSNYPSTAKCLPTYIQAKNIDLVTKHGIYTEDEFRARYEIQLDSYRKIINIEAKTCVDMALHQILPAAFRYTKDLSKGILRKKELGLCCDAEIQIAQQLSRASDTMYQCCERLQRDLVHIPEDKESLVIYYREVIVADMELLRAQADILESLTDKSYWPYPTYSDLLFY